MRNIYPSLRYIVVCLSLATLSLLLSSHHSFAQNTWTGATSTAWATSSNWSAGTVPTATTDVVINAGGNQPIISAAAAANNITINTGATLSLAGTVTLAISGTLSILGTLSASGTNQTINFNGAGPNQPIPGGTYYNIQFNGSGNKVLQGNVTANGAASILTNNKIFLGNYTFTIGASATISAGSTRYWVSNGTGGLKKMNLSTTPFVYPLGTTTSYTPFQLNNSGGTADNFTGRVIDGAYASYINDVPQGSTIDSQVIAKTYFITEDVPGGSSAQLIIQWNQSDEKPQFTRSNLSFSHYVNGSWISSPAQQATGYTGPGPYLATLNGITSFSPFSLGNAAAGPLPLDILSFTGKPGINGTELSWTTANEQNASSFAIEKRTDSIHFVEIGHLPAQANGESGQHSYHFIDRSPAPLAYYRIKTIDLDRSFKYSLTIPIRNVKGIDGRFTIAPNPVMGARLTIRHPANADAPYRILDLSGRVRSKGKLSDGAPIDVSGLSAGSYLIHIIYKGERTVLKFQKQ